LWPEGILGRKDVARIVLFPPNNRRFTTEAQRTQRRTKEFDVWSVEFDQSSCFIFSVTSVAKNFFVGPGADP
jgi:hypothetical protein